MERSQFKDKHINTVLINIKLNSNGILLSDIDEFAYSTVSGKNIKEIVIEYATTKTPYIKVPRFNFGNSGHMKKPNNGVVKNYTKREKNISSYKTISNVDYIHDSKKIRGVHKYRYKKGWVGGINKGIKIKGNLSPSYSKIPLIMNHYYTKSYDEYLEKM